MQLGATWSSGMSFKVPSHPHQSGILRKVEMTHEVMTHQPHLTLLKM